METTYPTLKKEGKSLFYCHLTHVSLYCDRDNYDRDKVAGLDQFRNILTHPMVSKFRLIYLSLDYDVQDKATSFP